MHFKKILAYAGINLLIAGPLFLSLLFYLQLVIGGRMGLGAMVFTFWFLVCIYVGRYAARLIPVGKGGASNAVLAGLFILALSAISSLILLGTFAYNGEAAYSIFVFAIPFLLFGVLAGMIIKLVRNRIALQLQEANVAAAQSRTELQLLQSQLSPHFLFNTLNNLYGISIAQHEKLPALLLKLADLLRYAVYDTHELLVPLADEMAYIHNYIDFEKIRLGDRLVLNISTGNIINPDIRIAPMLLIVFAENAFKHSKNTGAPHIYIDIDLQVRSDAILFSIRNSKGEQDRSDLSQRKRSGLGLINVKKRLDLLYAGEYKLDLEEEEMYYCVTLQLNVK